MRELQKHLKVLLQSWTSKVNQSLKVEYIGKE